MTRIVSPRFGISYPDATLRNEPADVPGDLKKIVDELDGKAAMYKQGTFAAMGAAGIPGRLYRTTDTKQTFWDTGSAWELTSSDAIAGTMYPWAYSEGSAPAGWALCYGQAVSRAANPLLNAIASSSAYPHGNGDGSTTFNLPDMRGRVPAGKDNMGGTAANRISAGHNGLTLGGVHGTEYHVLAGGEMPIHSHGGGTGGTAPGGVANNAGSHVHAIPPAFAVTTGTTASLGSGGTSRYLVTGVESLTYANGDHGHTVSVDSHGHSIGNDGGNVQHENMQPGMIVNWIIKLG